MAVVFLALNGEGLGHLVRATIVCSALESAGEHPILFSQGTYPLDGLPRFPGKRVPSLWRAPDDVRVRAARDLTTMASISLPAVVIEDTHPNPVTLPKGLRRVLLVRPTSFEYLKALRRHHGATYAAFLICDTPDSPTWPYTTTETGEIAGWRGWEVVGPIYRTATDDDVRDVRRRYRLADDEKVCVLTMGGGGVHSPNDPDVESFLGLAVEAAARIRRHDAGTRFVFVKGPYFPAGIAIPDHFEVVSQEPRMPALLRVAHGAVIRAGFNTTWECLAAGTPFIPLVGTTVAEPVPERLKRIEALGLLPRDADQMWANEAWRTAFTQTSAAVVTAHPGRPEPHDLRRLIVDRPRDTGPSSVAPRRVAPRRGVPRASLTRRGRVPLLIRVDDVACREPAVEWLLDLLASRRLRASLEVVPYLSEIDEGFLARFDPNAELFEVSQHGYAHVPRTTASGRRHEFSAESSAPAVEELEAIRWGKGRLERSFPRRFRGGFSPPFDSLPPWLPAAWRDEGGSFLSCLYTNHLPGSPVPVVRAGIDVWQWGPDHALSRPALRARLERQAVTDGHVGLVLHPRCLRTRWEKERLVSVLDYVERRGATTASLSSRAAARRAPPRLETLRQRLRSFLDRAAGGF